MLKRNPFRFLIALATMVTLVVAPAHARVEININKGNVEPLPIAVTDFLQGELGQKISDVVAADLKRSRPVCADRQDGLHRKDHQSGCGSAF